MSAVVGAGADPYYLPRVRTSPEMDKGVVEALDGIEEEHVTRIFPDLDEGAHALFACLKNIGHGDLRADVSQQYMLAAHGHAAHSFAWDPMMRGPADAAGLALGSAFVVPTAGMAIWAGQGEWRAARAARAAYEKKDQLLGEDIEHAAKLGHAERSAIEIAQPEFTKKLIAIAGGRREDNARAAKAQKLAGDIGKYSFLSGSAIMARQSIEVMRNAGMAMVGGTTHAAGTAALAKGSLIPALLTGSGIVSNTLAPIASLLAVALGVSFIRKTGKTSKMWRADLPVITREAEHIAAAHPQYAKFLKAKATQRKKFITSFHGKNRFFLLGAGVYAAGTTIPVCIKALAAVGVLNSKKVGTQVLLGLFAMGIGGAIVMGLFSHQFLYGHPAGERYDLYAREESPMIDRKFLSSVDVFDFRKPDGSFENRAFSKQEGAKIRAAAFQAVETREKLRVALLHDIAKSTGRRYATTLHLGDERYETNPGSRPLQTKIRLIRSRNRLRGKDIAEWANDAKNRPAVVATLTQMLDSQLQYLHAKDRVQKRMYDQIVDTHKDGKIDTKTLDQIVGNRPGLTTAPIVSHLNMVQALKGLDTADNAAFTNVVSEALGLQAGKKVDIDADHPLHEQLAEHLGETLKKHFSADRGMLLETEREAARRRTQAVASEHRPAFHLAGRV